uniref:MBF1 domain-containing protein n=1 Tax=Heterorhabditis bacteriophora TaxID=37862 RepID=A0A1I7XJG2_HETBA
MPTVHGYQSIWIKGSAVRKRNPSIPAKTTAATEQLKRSSVGESRDAARELKIETGGFYQN